MGGVLAAADIERLKDHLAMAGDPRDVLAARDSLRVLLGVTRASS